MNREPFNIVILISGEGTNLQALINASSRSSFRISAVISNKSSAEGLDRAKRSGIETFVIEHGSFDSRIAFEKCLAAKIKEIGPNLIVLAGFMRVLGSKFINLFRGKIINIHPSLLPKFKGLNTFEKALSQKEKKTGCTVHYVTEKLDSGKIILQKRVKLSKKETSSSLQLKILKQEHILYPRAIDKIFANR